MFSDCSSLTSLDLSNFDTAKITDMKEVFKGCTNLTTLDISNFDTSNVINTSDMFKIKNMSDMFGDCNNLKALKIGENFKIIKEEAKLPNSEGWVNENAPSTVISGSDEFAVIENNGSNTYKRFTMVEEEYVPTYPRNIRVEYSKEYHQVRFTWDKVEGADRYGIAVYLAGKWRVQTQTLTNTTYTSPKNLTPGKSYRVAIAARVNGRWDTTNAIRHSGTVTIR